MVSDYVALMCPERLFLIPVDINNRQASKATVKACLQAILLRLLISLEECLGFSQLWCCLYPLGWNQGC